jgi:hypothetical protein
VIKRNDLEEGGAAPAVERRRTVVVESGLVFDENGQVVRVVRGNGSHDVARPDVAQPSCNFLWSFTGEEKSFFLSLSFSLPFSSKIAEQPFLFSCAHFAIQRSPSHQREAGQHGARPHAQTPCNRHAWFFAPHSAAASAEGRCGIGVDWQSGGALVGGRRAVAAWPRCVDAASVLLQGRQRQQQQQ